MSPILFVEDEEFCERFKQKTKTILPIFGICIIGIILIPSKKEVFEIWGIGKTIEFLKENDVTKRIPKKCLDAIDIFLDSHLNKKTEATDIIKK